MIVTTHRLHGGDEASLQRARDPAAGQRLAGRSRTGDVLHRGYERDPLGAAPSVRCDSFARSLAAREGELWDCFSQNHSREERVLTGFCRRGLRPGMLAPGSGLARRHLPKRLQQ